MQTLNGGEASPFPDVCLFCDLDIENEKPVEVLGIHDRLEGYAHSSCSARATERADEHFIEVTL